MARRREDERDLLPLPDWREDLLGAKGGLPGEDGAKHGSFGGAAGFRQT